MAKGDKNKSAVATNSAADDGKATKRNSGRKDAIAFLKADHRAVEQLFRDYAAADSSTAKSQLVTRICHELTLHTLLEEDLFYPACREHGVETEMLDEAQVEHDGVKLLIAELQSHSPNEEYYDAKVTVLSRYVQDHIHEEEQKNRGIFAQAKKQQLDLKALGQRLQERKSELMQKPEASLSRRVQVRSLDLRSTQQLQQETYMNRQSNERYRDERGRFESDDDDRRYSSGYSSRGGRDQDDDNGRRGGRGWYGDSEGHARASERGWEERGGSRYARSRDEDDDGYSSRGGGRGHGRGGWFGDSEGHSEASERAYREGRRPGGWFGDSEAHSRAAERAWEEGRRPGGWFGDSEGHSRAAERRWEEGGRSRSSRRDDDDDDGRYSRGGGRGRGHEGWFGDSEGHSRASERGWEDRGGWLALLAQSRRG